MKYDSGGALNKGRQKDSESRPSIRVKGQEPVIKRGPPNGPLIVLLLKYRTTDRHPKLRIGVWHSVGLTLERYTTSGRKTKTLRRKIPLPS